MLLLLSLLLLLLLLPSASESEGGFGGPPAPSWTAEAAAARRSSRTLLGGRRALFQSADVISGPGNAASISSPLNCGNGSGCTFLWPSSLSCKPMPARHQCLRARSTSSLSWPSSLIFLDFEHTVEIGSPSSLWNLQVACQLTAPFFDLDRQNRNGPQFPEAGLWLRARPRGLDADGPTGSGGGGCASARGAEGGLGW